MRRTPLRLVGAVLAGGVSVSVLTGCDSRGAGEPSADAAGAARVVAGPTTFHGTLLDPAVPRPDLSLRTTDGRRFRLDGRPADEITVLFFGYTHCPDVCPTTMADLAAARRLLPTALRERVTVAFVTEDPKRDTPAVLRGWLDRFDPDFVGLRGGTPDTRRVLEELHLPESRRVANPSPAVSHPEDGHQHPGDYGVEHSGVVYAFGPRDATLIYTGGTTPREYAADLQELVSRG